MKERFLIVDDIAENRELLKSVLESDFEIDLDEAKDGFDAIRLAHLHCYDIILMDVKMPKMDGYATVEQIKQIDQNKNAKIIYISAQEQDEKKINKALNSGGIDFILKPIDIDELKKLLSLYLRFIRKEKKYLKQLKQTNTYLNEEISKRKKFEVQFLKSEESFKSIVGKSEAAILIINNKGIIKFVNAAGEKIFGVEAKELIGDTFGIIAEYDSKTEINIVRHNGEIGVGELTTTKTSWENEPAWLVLINDITAHKKLQENLVAAKEKAQESDRLKSAFLSNMSHEIRTPMNGILGFLDFIDEEENKEKRKSYTDIIRNSGNHLLSLINDIIDISKIEAGQLTIRLGECHIDNLIINLFKFFRKNPQVIKKELELNLDCCVDEGDLVIKSDSDRIHQVFINLIGNAIKFTNEGSIKFGYRKKGLFLEFFVTDTGKGIPEDMLKNVFDRFIQVKDETETFTHGTGLGLAISKSIVELLGGEIWVNSQLDTGTTFYFTIPNTKYQEVFKTDVVKEKPAKNLDSNQKLKILIAEDEPVNHKLLAEILHQINAELVWVKDGKEAIETHQNNTFDIILMDIKMPVLNGFEATSEIRKKDKTTPIIAQTAMALEGEKEKCLEVGCTAYISKPINRTELLQMIQEHTHTPFN